MPSMEMLYMIPVESLKFLDSQSKATSPQNRIVKAPAEPDHVYYVLNGDGNLTRREAAEAPYAFDASDMGTVAKLSAGWQGAHVWYSRDAIILTSGRDRATLSIKPSPQLLTLAEWERPSGVEKPQADFIRLLRVMFADCYGDHPDLLKIIRGVRTSKTAAVDSQIQQGKVSLKREHVAEMSGTAEVPDTVTFLVPVFASPQLPVRTRVRVAIDPNPEREVFNLTTLAGQIELAYSVGEAWLAERMQESLEEHTVDVPLYFGSPE